MRKYVSTVAVATAIALAAASQALSSFHDTSLSLDMALQSYKKAIRLRPRLIPTIKDARLRKELGESFLAEARMAMSERKFEKAKEAFLMAGNFVSAPELYLELGNCYMYLQEWQRAIVLYKKTLSANRSNAMVLANLGLAYDRTGKRDLAAETFCKALSLDSRIRTLIKSKALRGAVVDTLTRVAEDYEGRRMPFEAIERLRLALELERTPALLMKLGKTYQGASRLDEAVKCFQAAILADASLIEEIRDGSVKEQISVSLYNGGVDHYKKGHSKKAEGMFRISNQLVPRAKTLYNLGNCAVARGDLAEAVERYQEAIRRDERTENAYLNLALIYLEQKKTEQAIDTAKKLVVLNPSVSKAYDLIASAYEAGKDQEKAARVYVAAVRYDTAIGSKLQRLPVRARAGKLLYEEAAKAFRKKKYEEAVDTATKAAALHPTFDAYYLIGNAQVTLSNLPLAAEAYQRATSLSPTNAKVRNNLGNVYLKLCKADEALACFQKAVALKPDYVQAYNNLGIAYRKKGFIQRAIGAYKKALSIDPNYAAAHYNLGNAYSAMAGAPGS